MSLRYLWQKIAGKRFSTRTQPGFVTPMRGVPDHISKTDYYSCGTPKTAADRIHLFEDEDEILKIRNSAKLARKILDFASRTALPGMTTEELDILCHNEIVKHNACPSPINYHGFPKAICTSVNDVICHGIPDSRMLKDGDVLSIDVSVFLNGYHGDNCTTVIVGRNTDENANKLVSTTKESLEAGIAACKPGGCVANFTKTVNDITPIHPAACLQLDVANSNGFAVVREFLGHGTGPILHMKPLVHHYRNRHSLELRPGMVFTIEPILVEGGRRIKVWEDGWTACTFDGGRGAQFEHQVLITDEGVEVLTVSSD